MLIFICRENLLGDLAAKGKKTTPLSQGGRPAGARDLELPRSDFTDFPASLAETAREDPSDTAGGRKKKRQLLIVPVNLNTQHLRSKEWSGVASQAACRGFRSSTARHPAAGVQVALYPLLIARRSRTSGPRKN